MLPPHDAQGGVGAREPAQAHGGAALREVHLDAFGRGEEERLVEAEAHGRKPLRLAFAEGAVHGGELHLPFKAVHLPRVQPVHKKGAGDVR